MNSSSSGTTSIYLESYISWFDNGTLSLTVLSDLTVFHPQTPFYIRRSIPHTSTFSFLGPFHALESTIPTILNKLIRTSPGSETVLTQIFNLQEEERRCKMGLAGEIGGG